MAKVDKRAHKAVRYALATAVAGRKVSDAKINRVAEQIAEANFQISAIDICVYGICIDYFMKPNAFSLERLRVNEGIMRKLEVFPYGIIAPELLHVRASFDFAEIPNLRG